MEALCYGPGLAGVAGRGGLVGLVVGVVLGIVLGAIFYTDVTQCRVPNALVIPAILLVAYACLAWNPGALTGGVGWWLLLSAMHRRSLTTRLRSGSAAGVLGGGDAKLGLVAGAIASWGGALGCFLGLGLTGLFATLAHLATTRAMAPEPRGGRVPVAEAVRRRALPMAPAMILGAVLAYAALNPA